MERVSKKGTLAAVLAALVPAILAVGYAGAHLIEAEAEMRKVQMEALRAETEARQKAHDAQVMADSFQDYIEYVMEQRGCEP